MPDISNSVPTELPSTQQLIRSTIIALVIASVLLVAVVLPAEYGVDPTGIGNVLGLTEMGRIKRSLAADAAKAAQESEKPDDSPVAVVAANPDSTPALAAAEPAGDRTRPRVPLGRADVTLNPVTPPPSTRSDVVTITLEPNQGREIKLAMREGARVTYSWSTDRGVVNYDLHADSTNPPRKYYGYEKGSAKAKAEGVLVAAFEGSHGWFWRNRGSQPLTVTLRASGDYQGYKEVK